MVSRELCVRSKEQIHEIDGHRYRVLQTQAGMGIKGDPAIGAEQRRKGTDNDDGSIYFKGDRTDDGRASSRKALDLQTGTKMIIINRQTHG